MFNTFCFNSFIIPWCGRSEIIAIFFRDKPKKTYGFGLSFNISSAIKSFRVVFEETIALIKV